MGLCVSKFNERYLLATEGLQPFFDKLGMDNQTCTQLFRLFHEIDQDESGSIVLDEFFDFFELENTPFAIRTFAILDVDKSRGGANALDFGEFVAGLYNFCTMDHDMMVKFAFEIYDRDSSGEIGRNEVKSLVKLIYGQKKMNARVQEFMDKGDKDGDDSISLQEFRLLEKRNRLLLQPAFSLQQRLRLVSGGTEWWLRQQRKRFARLKRVDILDLFYYTRTGKKLDRAVEERNKGYRKDGWVRKEIAEEILVLEEPRKESAVLRTLQREDKVEIFGEERDVNDPKQVWYLIHPNEPQWVKAEFIQIDATWDKYNDETNENAETGKNKNQVHPELDNAV